MNYKIIDTQKIIDYIASFYGAVHHRTRNALRNLCADHEDFHQLHFGKEQAGLDRPLRTAVRRTEQDKRTRENDTLRFHTQRGGIDCQVSG